MPKDGKENALVFLQKWHDIDTARAAEIQGYIDGLKKMPVNTPGKTPGQPNPKGSAPTKTGSPKSAVTKPKTTKAIAKH